MREVFTKEQEQFLIKSRERLRWRGQETSRSFLLSFQGPRGIKKGLMRSWFTPVMVQLASSAFHKLRPKGSLPSYNHNKSSPSKGLWCWTGLKSVVLVMIHGTWYFLKEPETLVSHSYLPLRFIAIPQLTTNTRGSKKKGYHQMISPQKDF